MANVWLSNIYNRTDTDFVLKQNDFWWRPTQKPSGRKYAEDERIEIRGDRDYRFDGFSVPWVSPGENRRLRVEGPDGALEFYVGPENGGNQDFLFGFDEQRQVVTRVPLGPQGVGNTVWLSLSFNNVNGMLWRVEKSEGYVDDALKLVLTKADKLFDKAADVLIAKIAEDVYDAVKSALAGAGGGGGGN